MQYIVLEGKRPTNKFKDGKGTYTKEQVKDFDDVAVVVPKGYIVLDFDTKSDAEIMLKIVDGLGLKTRVMQTTRGIHCWFKSSESGPKNFIKNRLAIGIYCDRKAGGRNAYVKIKNGGKNRAWIRKIDFKDIQEAPKWLTSVSSPTDKFQFKDLGEGSGRNQELFNYVVYLQAKGFSRDEIKEAIKVINDYVLLEPLPGEEIETILREEAFKSDEEIEAQQKKSAFDHVDIAEELIKEHNLINFNSCIYEYNQGCYRPCETLGKYIRQKVYAIKTNQRNEVINYIQDMEKVTSDTIKIDPYVVNLKNTRLNLKTGECLPFTPDVIDFSQLPVEYNPSVYNSDLDKMLNRVFTGDKEIRLLFEELLGAMLIKHSKYQKAFLFYGGGSNGKSTILNLIKTFLGEVNYSTLALEKVTDRFNTVELENKLANIGDDIDNVTIKDTGTLKKLFAGNSVMVEKKGERPYTIEPYALHVYSANTIPRSLDKTDGFYRRWMIIPFNARFTIDDEDFDPLIEEKITTDEALSYMLNIAINGANRLIKFGKFTEPEKTKNLLEEYKIDNSTVLTWVDDNGKDEDYYLDTSRDELYDIFKTWCDCSGIYYKYVPGKKNFYKEMINIFNFEDKAKLRKADGKRYFVQKL